MGVWERTTIAYLPLHACGLVNKRDTGGGLISAALVRVFVFSEGSRLVETRQLVHQLHYDCTCHCSWSERCVIIRDSKITFGLK